MASTQHTWLVVADGEHAAIYVRKKSERFVPLRAKQGATHDHYTPKSEWELHPVRELKAEPREHYELEQNEGRAFDSAGYGRHRTGDKTPLNEQRSRQLMDTLAEMLNEAFAQHEYTRLVITAPPKLLGELREQLDKPVRAAILAELDKNLSHEPADVLVQVMNEAMKAQL